MKSTPVKEFKAQIDAYINQINDVISDIQRTDEFEEKRKAEKQVAIQNLINEMAGNYALILNQSKLIKSGLTNRPQ